MSNDTWTFGRSRWISGKRFVIALVLLALGLLIGVASVVSCRWLVSWQHTSGTQWTLLGGSIVYRAAHASKSGTSMSTSSATTVIDQRHWLWPSFQWTWQVRDPNEVVWPGIPPTERAWWNPRIAVMPVWLVSVVLLVFGGWSTWRAWRRGRVGTGACVACGYSLAGHGRTGAEVVLGVLTCPECGSQNRRL